MSVFNSISVAVLIVLLVAGLVTGLSAAGTDLFNPNTSQAEADRVRAETTHQGVMNELQERLESAKTEAEIASIQRQQEAEQKRFEEEMKYIEQLYAKKLTAYDRWIKVRDILLLVFGSVFSLGFLVFIFAKSALMLRSIQPAPQQVVNDEEVKQYWRNRREMACANERWFRSTALMEARMKAVCNPASMSKEQYNNLPLAG